MTEATNPQQLAKAISDANEAKLVDGTDAMVTRGKQPGTLRVGVPEVDEQDRADHRYPRDAHPPHLGARRAKDRCHSDGCRDAA